MNTKILKYNMVFIFILGLLSILAMVSEYNYLFSVLLAIVPCYFIFCILMIAYEAFHKRYENMSSYLISLLVLLIVGLGSCFAMIGAFKL